MKKNRNTKNTKRNLRTPQRSKVKSAFGGRSANSIRDRAVMLAAYSVKRYLRPRFAFR